MERKRDSIPSTRARKRSKRGKEKVDHIESQELGPSFADLPLPITTDILLRLSTKPILICKRVCKTWNTLISDPYFTKLHFQRSSISFLIRTCDPKLVSRTMYLLEDEPQEFDDKCKNILKLEPTLKLPLHRFDVANSCNGLLCLCDPIYKDPLLVCNPVTGECIRLPKVPKESKKFQIPIGYGIGFQPKTNVYKVVRMWTNAFTNMTVYTNMTVEINVVGTPTWRKVWVYDSLLGEGMLQYPTFMNETIYWILFWGKRLLIFYFNFETERLGWINFPSLLLLNGILREECISMGTLRDSLYVCNATLCSSMQVWIMKKHDKEVVWTKSFTLSMELHRGISVSWIVKHFESATAILDYHSKKGFTYYDPETNRSKRFHVSGTRDKLLEVIPHIPSLISLKDVVKGDNVEVLNVHSRCAEIA